MRTRLLFILIVMLISHVVSFGVFASDDNFSSSTKSQFIFPPLPDSIDTSGRNIKKSQVNGVVQGNVQAAGIAPLSEIVSPVDGSNIAATTIFRWSDEGANQYLFRLSAIACYQGDLVNQFSIPGSTTSYPASGLDPSQIVYASIWAQTISGGNYTARDCTVYNVDADSDGIYNELDPNPNQFDASQSYSFGSNKLTVLPTGRVATLKISPTQYNELSAGNTSSLSDISNLIYEFYQDAFDFLFFTNDQSDASAGYVGQYHLVQNDISGIGASLFNSSGFWGSDDGNNPANNDGQLQGVIHFPTFSNFSTGPGLHELMHRWGNYLSSIPAGSSGGHWNFSSAQGQLGGWAPDTLEDLGGGQYQANSGRPGSNSFGTFANGGNGLAFSNLELYVMGMIPQVQLETMQYATNPAWVTSSTGIFSADSIETVTAAQLVAIDGARVPNSVNSQKNFKVLNVILTAGEVSTAKLGMVDEQAYRFGLAADEGTSSFNFWEATGGRGTLDMGLSQTELKPGLIPDPMSIESDEICIPIITTQQTVAIICL